MTAVDSERVIAELQHRVQRLEDERAIGALWGTARRGRVYGNLIGEGRNRRGGRRQSGGSKSRGQNETRTKRESCPNHKARKQDADMRGYSIGSERGASPRGNAFSTRAISSADNFRWSAAALSAE